MIYVGKLKNKKKNECDICAKRELAFETKKLTSEFMIISNRVFFSEERVLDPFPSPYSALWSGVLFAGTFVSAAGTFNSVAGAFVSELIRSLLVALDEWWWWFLCFEELLNFPFSKFLLNSLEFSICLICFRLRDFETKFSCKPIKYIEKHQ